MRSQSRKDSLLRFFTAATLSVFVALSLAACGGGGGGSTQAPAPVVAQTVSGVAATGLPIYGTVTLRDAHGVIRGPVATAADGSFTIDVTGLAAPFMLKIEWGTAPLRSTLYSVAAGAGCANINPFSHLALLLAAGNDLAGIFDSATSQGLTPDAIEAALAKIRAFLAPLLARYNVVGFDPISGSYVAGPSNPLDTLLDLIVIGVNGDGTLTMRNAMNGDVVASGALADIAGVRLDATMTPNPVIANDIRDITARLGALCAAMRKGPALTTADLEDLFIVDPYYGTSNRRTRAEDMASVVGVFGPNGTNTKGRLAAIRNVRIYDDMSARYLVGRGVAQAYLLFFDFVFESGEISHGNGVVLGKEDVTGQWKFIGDPEGWRTIVGNGGMIAADGSSGYYSLGSSGFASLSSGSAGTFNMTGGTNTLGCSFASVGTLRSVLSVNLILSASGTFHFSTLASVTVTLPGVPTVNEDGSYTFQNCGPIVINTSSSSTTASVESITIHSPGTPAINEDGSYTFQDCGLVDITNMSNQPGVFLGGGP